MSETITTPTESPEAIAVRDASLSVLTKTRAIVISNDAEYQSAVGLIADIAAKSKELEKTYRKLKDPIVAAGKAIDAFFAGPRTQLDDARRMVDNAARGWRAKLEEEQRAAQRKLDEERRAAEAKANADRIAAEKLAAEAEEKASAAASTGDLMAELAAAEEQEAAREQVAEANAKAVQVATAPTPFVPPPAKTERLDTGAKVSFVKVWTFIVTDPALVPRQYCRPVDALIRSAVKAGAREIPGVMIFDEERSSAR